MYNVFDMTYRIIYNLMPQTQVRFNWRKNSILFLWIFMLKLRLCFSNASSLSLSISGHGSTCISLLQDMDHTALQSTQLEFSVHFQ